MTQYSIELYKCMLPSHVFFVHPTGTVIGRSAGPLGDWLTFYQCATIGESISKNNGSGNPSIGSNIIFFHIHRFWEIRLLAILLSFMPALQ